MAKRQVIQSTLDDDDRLWSWALDKFIAIDRRVDAHDGDDPSIEAMEKRAKYAVKLYRDYLKAVRQGKAKKAAMRKRLVSRGAIHVQQPREPFTWCIQQIDGGRLITYVFDKDTLLIAKHKRACAKCLKEREAFLKRMPADSR